MKTTLAILVLSLASFANAALEAIPADSLQTYKTAVLASMKGVGYQCQSIAGTGSYAAVKAISDATEGSVDTAGGQPLLVLSQNYYKGLLVISITTTEGLKEVVSYTSETFVIGDVNSGNLKVPNMGKGWVSEGKALCNRMKSKYEQ